MSTDVGILGLDDGAGRHVEVTLQNVAVGPDITVLKGKRNVLLGTNAATYSIYESENVVAGWSAARGIGGSNVILGSRAGTNLLEDTTYSVVVGPRAAINARTIRNSIMMGPRVGGDVSDVRNSTMIGTNLISSETVENVSIVGSNSLIGDEGSAVAERITGHVSNSWLTGTDIVAFGDQIVTESGKNNIVAIGDNIIAGGSDSLLVGTNVSSGAEGSNNQIFGMDTTILDPHVNVLALGAGPIEIDRSNVEYIGTGITYDKNTNTMELKGEFKATGTKTDLGDGVLVVDKGQGMTTRNSHNYDATFELGLELKHGLDKWTIKMEPGEYDQYDLVMESDRGTRVIFKDDYEPGVTNFTGQHRCLIVEADIQDARHGHVVYATGDYASLDRTTISIDEAIPIVSLTRKNRDTRAFGVVSDLEGYGDTRSVAIGFMRFILRKPTSERRVRVNGAGEGAILVCGQNGDINNGDLLCTSDKCGLAMKQFGSCVTNYTCAKATSHVFFRTGERSRLVGCVYKF